MLSKAAKQTGLLKSSKRLHLRNCLKISPLADMPSQPLLQFYEIRELISLRMIEQFCGSEVTIFLSKEKKSILCKNIVCYYSASFD
jgi:hypothetical protein